MINTFSIIMITTIFSLATILILMLMARQRLLRLNQTETQITNQVNKIDATRLKSHLKDIGISTVSIDDAASALTTGQQQQPSAAPNPHTKQESIIRIFDKDNKLTTRVG